jgi:hypothetical protein
MSSKCGPSNAMPGFLLWELGSTKLSSVNGLVRALFGDDPTARSRVEWRCDCSRLLEPYASR